MPKNERYFASSAVPSSGKYCVVVFLSGYSVARLFSRGFGSTRDRTDVKNSAKNAPIAFGLCGMGAAWWLMAEQIAWAEYIADYSRWCIQHMRFCRRRMTHMHRMVKKHLFWWWLNLILTDSDYISYFTGKNWISSYTYTSAQIFNYHIRRRTTRTNSVRKACIFCLWSYCVE